MREGEEPAAGRSTWPTTQITLLQRVADQQDKPSWDYFVQTYSPLIYRYCQRRGLQDADAFDVVQDVLLQVSKGIASFRYDAERGKFRNWLGTVTHRAMLKHRAKSTRSGIGAGDGSDVDLWSTQEGQPSLDEAWVESFNGHVYREAVRRIRIHFNEETWRAFAATFIDEQPPEAVAKQLERSVGWIYQAKSQVVRRLKAEILFLAEDSILLTMNGTESGKR